MNNYPQNNRVAAGKARYFSGLAKVEIKRSLDAGSHCQSEAGNTL